MCWHQGGEKGNNSVSFAEFWVALEIMLKLRTTGEAKYFWDHLELPRQKITFICSPSCYRQRNRRAGQSDTFRSHHKPVTQSGLNPRLPDLCSFLATTLTLRAQHTHFNTRKSLRVRVKLSIIKVNNPKYWPYFQWLPLGWCHCHLLQQKLTFKEQSHTEWIISLGETLQAPPKTNTLFKHDNFWSNLSCPNSYTLIKEQNTKSTY